MPSKISKSGSLLFALGLMAVSVMPANAQLGQSDLISPNGAHKIASNAYVARQSQGQMGMSDWVLPGSNNNAYGGSSAAPQSQMGMSNWVQPGASSYDASAGAFNADAVNYGEPLNAGTSYSYVASNQFDQSAPAYAGGMSNSMAQPVAYDMSTAAPAAQAFTGAPAQNNGGAMDCMGKAIATAAAVGIIGGATGGGIGDAMRGMGFDNRFHTYGAACNGTVYAGGPRPVSTGGGYTTNTLAGMGGTVGHAVGRKLNREVNRVINQLGNKMFNW